MAKLFPQYNQYDFKLFLKQFTITNRSLLYWDTQQTGIYITRCSLLQSTQLRKEGKLCIL